MGTFNQAQNITLEKTEDSSLIQLLTDYQITSLYDILHNAFVTVDSIWELTEENLLAIGMEMGHIIKYKNAKRKWEARPTTIKGKWSTIC